MMHMDSVFIDEEDSLISQYESVPYSSAHCDSIRGLS